NKIKDLQEQIIKAQEKYLTKSGLTGEEANRLSSYYDIKNSGGDLTREEQDDMAELTKRKASPLLDKFESAELNKAFQELRSLQSKVPTDYYMEIINNHLTTLGLPTMDASDIEMFLENTTHIESLLDSDPQFKDWFLKN